MQVAGCRVVVVGGSKTAVDTATRLGSAGAAEITVVYRKVRRVAGGGWWVDLRG